MVQNIFEKRILGKVGKILFTKNAFICIVLVNFSPKTENSSHFW